MINPAWPQRVAWPSDVELLFITWRCSSLVNIRWSLRVIIVVWGYEVESLLLSLVNLTQKRLLIYCILDPDSRQRLIQVFHPPKLIPTFSGFEPSTQKGGSSILRCSTQPTIFTLYCTLLFDQQITSPPLHHSFHPLPISPWFFQKYISLTKLQELSTKL